MADCFRDLLSNLSCGRPKPEVFVEQRPKPVDLLVLPTGAAMRSAGQAQRHLMDARHIGVSVFGGTAKMAGFPFGFPLKTCKKGTRQQNKQLRTRV